jgi:phosphotransferase system HPr (HPr) family protein
MVSQEIIVTDEIGFHARTAAIFAKTVAKFDSTIFLSFKEKKVNARSMLAIMTLGVKKGDEITLIAEGADEDVAIEQLASLIESNFVV